MDGGGIDEYTLFVNVMLMLSLSLSISRRCCCSCFPSQWALNIAFLERMRSNKLTFCFRLLTSISACLPSFHARVGWPASRRLLLLPPPPSSLSLHQHFTRSQSIRPTHTQTDSSITSRSRLTASPETSPTMQAGRSKAFWLAAFWISREVLRAQAYAVGGWADEDVGFGVGE